MTKRYRNLLVVALVLLAVAIELSFIPLYSLALDQSQVLYLAWDFVNEGIFPVRGVLNSRQAYNPPFFVWLYLIPMLLLRDYAWILTLPALLLHILAVLCLHKLGRRYFNFWVGLAASALYAFSPRGVYFGRASWAQALLAPLYILMMFLMSRWLLERRSWSVALLVPLAAWMTGIHWAGVLTFGVLTVSAFLFQIKLRARPLVMGAAVSLLLWIPYLGFEYGRGFADILALVREPVPAPAPEELTSFCEQSTEQGLVQGEAGDRASQPEDRSRIGRLGDTIRSRHPRLYHPLRSVYGGMRSAYWALHSGVRKVRGLFRSLSVNFHWSPWHKVSGSLWQRAFYFAGTALFFTGLGTLLYRWAIRKTASSEEKWLLLAFLLPALLQNLSPNTALTRPDVCWLFYGPQMLIIAYTLTLPKGVYAKATTVLFVTGVGIMLVLSGYDLWKSRLRSGDGIHPQRRMVSWIAEDLHRQGLHHAVIRYDFLAERLEWCWIVSYATLDDRYYIGTQYDYLLVTRHDTHNTAQAMDGWAEDPDYIVLFPEGLARYEYDQYSYEMHEFDRYVVLKVVPDAR